MKFLKEVLILKHISINLLDDKTEFGFMPTMDTYILDGADDRKKRPAVVICPGGAYAFVSGREAERIALSYNAAGYHAFVVNYAVAPHKHPLPIMNAAKAIEIVREHAGEWFVDSDKIAVCGFSAGGHLAASISTLWNDPEIFSDDEEKNKLHRPNATILAYPVISSGEHAHAGSFDNLTGTKDIIPLREKLSLEKRVTEQNPPAFLWHTYEDNAVPVENSLLFASALRKHNIPLELHIFQKGEHGASLASDETIWSIPAFSRKYPWMQLSEDWLNELFGLYNK